MSISHFITGIIEKHVIENDKNILHDTRFLTKTQNGR